MDLVKQDLFPVPIFFNQWDNCDSIIENTVDYLKNKNNLINYTANGLTTYGHDNDILEQEFLHELRNFIGHSVSSVSNSIGLGSQVYFTGSWLTLNNQYSYHEAHNHLPDVWSGVYYVKANNNDAPLTFVNNNFSDNWPYRRFSNESEYCYSSYSYAPATGRLIIFPSYLWHKVEQQKIEQDRITIAFNMKLK